MSAGATRPCRPYRLGDHGRAWRRRMWMTLAVGFVSGAVVSTAVPVAFNLGGAPLPPEVLAWASWVLFIGTAFAVHWLAFGVRRWRALELTAWAGRIEAAAFRAVTGIRDPLNRDAAAAWLEAQPRAADEEPDRLRWRAYLELLVGRPDVARTLIGELATVPGRAIEADLLEAMVAQLEGSEIELDALERAVAALEPSAQRAMHAADVAALRMQVTWTCAGDDVSAGLRLAPLIAPHADGHLLRVYWLPLTALTVGGIVLLTLLGGILAPPPPSVMALR